MSLVPLRPFSSWLSRIVFRSISQGSSVLVKILPAALANKSCIYSSLTKHKLAFSCLSQPSEGSLAGSTFTRPLEPKQLPSWGSAFLPVLTAFFFPPTDGGKDHRRRSILTLKLLCPDLGLGLQLPSTTTRAKTSC